MTTRSAPGDPTHPSKRPRLQDMTNNSPLAAVDTNGRSPGSEGVGWKSAAAAPPTHGTAISGKPLGRSGLIDRCQYVRLLEQALVSLGFDEVAQQLEAASGIASQAPEVNQLQRAILAGDWAAATKLVGQLHLVSSHGSLQEAKFIILEQAFLEAVRRGDSLAALTCLREQIAPLGVHTKRLHQLAACLMGGCSPAGLDEMEQSSSIWLDEPSSDSRRQVLRRLQAVIPPEVMLPEGRLEELVEQALAAQISACRFHNTLGVRPSLLTDYTCGTEQIPTCTTQVLLDHSDEVWHLQFAHNGSMLASCGKDQSVIIWDVQRSSSGSTGGSSSGTPAGGVVSRRHVLRGHTGSVAFLCWSPDDSKLATCGQDGLRLWDAASGHCLCVMRHHKEAAVTCAAWFPDGRRLVTGSHDKQLCIVGLDGSVQRQWRVQRVQEVLVAKGGRYILASPCERKVRVYDLDTDTESFIPESETLLSMSLSPDGRYLLVNLASNCMHLWDLGPSPRQMLAPTTPCATYQGPNEKQSRFVVRSCLGGLDGRFVLTGSEECCVYVYHRQTGERLLSLEGHSGTVNSVAWNPADPHMFASASDDKSIHIWQTVAEAGPVAGGLQ